VCVCIRVICIQLVMCFIIFFSIAFYPDFQTRSLDGAWKVCLARTHKTNRLKPRRFVVKYGRRRRTRLLTRVSDGSRSSITCSPVIIISPPSNEISQDKSHAAFARRRRRIFFRILIFCEPPLLKFKRDAKNK